MHRWQFPYGKAKSMGDEDRERTSPASAGRSPGVLGLVVLVALVGALTRCRREPGVANANASGASSSSVTTIPVDEGTPKDGGKVTFGIDAEPDGFDPSASQLAVHSHLIASSMIESLATFDADKNPQPFLAESI